MAEQTKQVLSIETTDGNLEFYMVQGGSIEKLCGLKDGASTDSMTLISDDQNSLLKSAQISHDHGSLSKETEGGGVNGEPVGCMTSSTQDDNDTVVGKDGIDAQSVQQLKNLSVALSEYTLKHETFKAKRIKGSEREVTLVLTYTNNKVTHKYTMEGKGLVFENKDVNVSSELPTFEDKQCFVKMDNIVVSMSTCDDVNKCETCGRVFKYTSHLTNHTKVHELDKHLECDLCTKKFSHLGNYTQHRKLKHPDAIKFKCTKPSCEKEFSFAGNLMAHEKVHDGVKSYKCDACDKEFYTRKNLVRHAKLHTTEKRHLCSICNRAFSMKSYLKDHMRVHTGETPFKCEDNQCNARFKYRTSLKTHIATEHTGLLPYQCDVCNKYFARNFNLKLHQRIHTGERPYNCTHCGKTFIASTDLSRHVRIHTGEKPYKCGVCEKSFTQNTSLKSHMNSHLTGHSAMTSGEAVVTNDQMHVQLFTIVPDAIN